MQRIYHRFATCTRGNVLMLTGLAILVLVAVAGAGVDFGRQQLVRMKLQNASDAGAIAAASLPQGATTAERTNIAQRYFNLNFPESFLGIKRPTPQIEITGDRISVDASTEMDANFVSNVGVDKLGAQGRTVVNATQPENSIHDVILVMDNSGSMAFPATAPSFTNATDPQAQRNIIILACRELVQPFYNLSCATAQCGNQEPLKYCQGFGNGVSQPPTPTTYGFTGSTRLNALRSAAFTFADAMFKQGEKGSRIGLVPWSTGILFSSLPLTDDENAVRVRINQMGAFDATNPVVAMNAAITLAKDFNPKHVKAVVLMTDGKPTYSHPNGIAKYVPAKPHPVMQDDNGCNGNTFCTPAVNATIPLCTQLKNDGVMIYVIAFGPEVTTGPDASKVQKFLGDCASPDEDGKPRLLLAPDGKTLQDAFRSILVSLGKIRIAE